MKGDNMPKGSAELTEARRTEIMEACKKLYENMTFKDVNLKEIGKVTTFSRTSIYNYFESKEEIFLGIFEDEYIKWTMELQKIIDAGQMSREKLAKKLADSLGRRKLMLKLLSVNLYDMEENSRQENLVEFKRAYGASIKAVHRCLDKFCPEMTEEEKASTIAWETRQLEIMDWLTDDVDWITGEKHEAIRRLV